MSSMNETHTQSPHYTGKIRTKYAEAAAPDGVATVVEFVGASDATIAEAVREALARASRSLRTLDGAGVLVIPQIVSQGGVAPRYRVTLQVTAATPDSAAVPSRPVAP
jgi:flavin-binding protein dodecin